MNKSAVGLACLLAIGCSSDSKTDSTGKPQQPSTAVGTKDDSVAAGDIGKKPDYVLTSVELAQEYDRDKKAARKKYTGETIELTGKVVGIGRNGSLKEFLKLEGVEGDIFQVMCFVRGKYPWLHATPGQIVKLQGEWPRLALGANLVDCQITEVKGEACPRVTAEQLAKEIDADPDAVVAKYKKSSHVIIEGTVASKDVQRFGAADVFLRHSGKCKISCGFEGLKKDLTAPLTVGQKIVVIGELSVDGSSVTLSECLLKVQ